MNDYIIFDKIGFPCSYDVVIEASFYTFTFKYNESCDLFTCTLAKGDNILVYDEPVVYGQPLFNDIYITGEFPAVNIVPLDLSGENKVITYDNFLRDVQLYIDNGEYSYE